MARRLVDAESLKNSMCSVLEMTAARAYLRLKIDAERMAVAINKVIDSEATVDAVEVVRCKECEYYRPEPMGDVMMCYGFAVGNWPGPEDFCSRGKKTREDGGVRDGR